MIYSGILAQWSFKRCVGRIDYLCSVSSWIKVLQLRQCVIQACIVLRKFMPIHCIINSQVFSSLLHRVNLQILRLASCCQYQVMVVVDFLSYQSSVSQTVLQQNTEPLLTGVFHSSRSTIVNITRMYKGLLAVNVTTSYMALRSHCTYEKFQQHKGHEQAGNHQYNVKAILKYNDLNVPHFSNM